MTWEYTRPPGNVKYASLLITTYNRMELLGESLHSLYENTYYPYELVIHDEGSEPRMIQWLTKLLTEGKISELILNAPGHNRGQGLGADRCYQVASGDYLVKLEGDEQFAPGWLEKAVRAMELFPEIGQLSLQQFYNTGYARTQREFVVYPDWDSYVVKEFQREDAKIAVVWCSPGGQFMVRKGAWEQYGPWDYGQETITFRMRVSPMMRLLKGFDQRYPPPTDKEAYWQQYKDTPWLAALDPPVVSSHWGGGRSLIAKANATMTPYPLILHKEGKPNYSVVRGDRFGPMPGYNWGKDLP
jgi:glycosyltransferase involved in cell wall biosynthesis